MPSIAFFSAHRAFPWSRQLAPARADWRVTLDEIAPDCRLLVVYDEPPEGLATHLPRANRLVILSEPPGIKRYPGRFLDQFGLVLGPIDPQGHGGRWLEGQPCLPWFFGIGFSPAGLSVNLTLEALEALSPPPKAPTLSAVLSTKSNLPKHRARLAFAEALKRRLGDRFRIFGRGFEPVGDKAEAILPHAYHLALENNDIPHFFTEKTADALLGFALPIFSGCANIGAYFPAGSIVPIDIARAAEAIDRIERLLDENPYAARLPAILEARARLLGPLSLAHRLAEIAAGLAAPEPEGTKDMIRPTLAFKPLLRLSKALRGKR